MKKDLRGGNVMVQTAAEALPETTPIINNNFFRRRARLLVPAITFLTAAGLLLAPLRAARADATTYGTSTRTFKVGILLLDSTIDTSTPVTIARGPENPDAHLFYIADARTDIKPANWQFINPLAPATVTSDIKARWDARENRSVYQLGQKVSKNMAAYWEVRLSEVSESELLQFDMLFITHHRDTRFTPQETERLRKLVDAGGVIWMEDCGNMRIRPDGPFFLTDLQFRAEGSAANAGPQVNVPNHPILNSPYPLSFQEIANLGDKNYANYYLSSMIPADRTAFGVPVPRGNSGRDLPPPSPQVLTNIVGNLAALDDNGNALPYIAAGNYGSGVVIATAGDSGCDVNDYAGGVNVGSGGNSGAICGPNLLTAHTEDLKFVYNLIAWGNSNTTDRRNNRRLGSSFESIGAPLLPRFDFTTVGTPAGSIVNSKTSPLIVNGVLFVTGVEAGTARMVLRAYDTQPGRDMDNDGNPDDGLPDLELGAPYDELWRVELGNAAGTVQASAPVYASIYSGAPVPLERIFVTLPDGTLAAVLAFPRDASGRIPAQNQATLATNPPENTAGAYPGGVAVAPAVVEGRVYVAQPNGLLRCVSARNLVTTLWYTFDNTSPPDPFITPIASPTIGFTRQQSGAMASNSGGTTMDLMLYLPVQEQQPAGTTVSANVLPYWLGTRNEVLREYNGMGVFRTRVGGAAGSPRGKYYIAVGDPFILPRVRVFQNDRDPANPSQILISKEENYAQGRESANYTGQFILGAGSFYEGDVQVQATGAGGGSPPQGEVMISVDYDVLYLVPGSSQRQMNLTGNGSRDSGSLRLGAYAGGQSLSAVAMTPDDLLIYTVDENRLINGVAGSPLASIYAMNEQFGTRTTRLRWRFQFHESYTATLDDQTVIEPAPLRNNLQFDPNWPEVDRANFVNATEDLFNVRVIGAPVVTNDGTSYMLMRADSALNNGPVTVLAAFRTNPIIVLNVGSFVGGVQVFQYNSLTGSQTTLDRSQYVADASRGTLTITNFQRGGGEMATLSQTFVVRLRPAGSNADVTQQHRPLNSVHGDDFSPLLWYYVLPGTAQSSPTLIGEYIYFTHRSNNATRLIALESNPASNDPLVKRAQQVINVVGTLGATPAKTNHVAWSLQRLDNPLIAGAPVALASPAGAQGSLAVNTSEGTFVFEDAITLVTDAKRLIEARPDGSVLWALDSTVRFDVAGGELPRFLPPDLSTPVNLPATGRTVLERKALNRPSFARRLTSSEYLVADTGNNRVLRVDRAGQIIWELDRLADPYRILASGDPVTLNEPSDVLVYRLLNATGYEVHYLVADTGNSRIIEVANYYNARGQAIPAPGAAAGTAGQHVVVWTTRTTAQEGRPLRYQSLQLSYERNAGTGFYGYPRLAVAISNTRAAGSGSASAADFSGGSIAILNYNPYNTAFTIRDANGAIQTPYLPWAANADASMTEPAGNGTLLNAYDDLLIVAADGVTTRTKRITRPLYFAQATIPDPTAGSKRIYLLCDTDGVYEIEPRLNPATNRTSLYVNWFFGQQDYNRINGVQPSGTPGQGAVVPDPANRMLFPSPTVALSQMPGFLPSSVRRLGNGNYLITNTYSGPSSLFESNQFVGEVFEVAPDRQSVAAPGTNRGGVPTIFSVPAIVRIAPGSNQQRMGRTESNTGLVEQPRSADRLF